MPEYLSIDPNAGTPIKGGGYLSTDPNAGDTDTPSVPDTSMLDTLIGLLPAAGGTLGGIVGGIGGTAFGMGIGGVPGAVGGATLGGAAGESARQLINRGRGKPSPETSMQALTELGKQGAIQGAAEGVGGAVMKGATKGARAVYRGYLKPSLAKSELGKADQIVDTALKEALPIARRGTAKASDLIADLKTAVMGILRHSGEKVDLHQVAEKVRAYAKRRYYKPGADASHYEAALKVADSIDKHPSLGLPPGSKPLRVDVSLSQANETKQALDTAIGDTAFGAESGAATSTRKHARHQVRKAMERKAPSIAPLNARESKLIDAAKAIARAVEREANQNPIYGVKTIVSAGYGGSAYARGDDPVTAAGKGLAARALLRPATQSQIAIVASRIAKQLGVSAATAARLAAHALQQSEQVEEE